MESKRAQNPLLNILRFICIMHLFFYHYFQHLFESSVLKYFISSGYYSTSIFFILSGFLLQRIYSSRLDTKAGRNAFWIARFSRSYPLYLLTILFYVALDVVGKSQESIPYVLTNLFISTFLLQAFVPIKDVVFLFNYEAWSLSALYFFYFLFPLILGKINRLESYKTHRLIPVFWIIYMLPPVITILTGFSENMTAFLLVTRNPVFRVPQFILGMLLARLYDDIKQTDFYSSLANHKLMIAGINILIVSVAYFLPPMVSRSGMLLPFQAILILSLMENGKSRLNDRVASFFNLLGNCALSFFLINSSVMEIVYKVVFLFDLGTVKHGLHIDKFSFSEIANSFSYFDWKFVHIPWFYCILISVMMVLLALLVQKYFVIPVSDNIKLIYSTGSLKIGLRNKPASASSVLSIKETEKE
ncbi:MAG: acyltransferase family protein [Bacteroidota bacterium]